MTQTHLLTVGISDCKASGDAGATLATHALGSCIAVAIHDPVAQVAGLLHYMLPDSALDAGSQQTRPFMYADTGIPALFRICYELGAVKHRMNVVLLGGAQVLNAEDTFHIGKRNHLAARKILWKAGVMVHYEDVGGNLPRTVHMDVESGLIRLSQGSTQREIVLKAKSRERVA